MLSSMPRAMDLFGHCISYVTDPELQARRFLMDAMIRVEGFAGLHGATRGRKPWPVRIMVRALYVQKEEGWSDRAMESQLKDNRRVRYLVGLPLDGPSPSRSALLDFRQRLLQAERHLLPAGLPATAGVPRAQRTGEADRRYDHRLHAPGHRGCTTNGSWPAAARHAPRLPHLARRRSTGSGSGCGAPAHASLARQALQPLLLRPPQPPRAPAMGSGLWQGRKASQDAPH